MIDQPPWGALIAVIFAASLAGVYYWMLRAPRGQPRLPAIPRDRGQGPPRILVPIADATSCDRAIELACRLGSGRKPDLVLVHVIEVPLTMLLDADMPDRDNAGREALEMGRVMARRYGCTTRTYLVHHRDTSEGVLQVARDEAVDAIVLGDGVEKPAISGRWRKLGADLLRQANCEVFVDRVPRAAKPIALPA